MLNQKYIRMDEYINDIINDSGTFNLCMCFELNPSMWHSFDQCVHNSVYFTQTDFLFLSRHFFLHTQTSANMRLFVDVIILDIIILHV